MPKNRYVTVTKTIPNGTAAGTTISLSNIVFEKKYKRCTGVAFVAKDVSPINVKLSGTSDTIIIDETPGRLWQTSDTPINERFVNVDFDPSIQTLTVDIKTRENLLVDVPLDIVFRLEE